MRTDRHPGNRAYLALCERLAARNPNWTIAQVEARATLIRTFALTEVPDLAGGDAPTPEDADCGDCQRPLSMDRHGDCQTPSCRAKREG